MLSKVSQAIRRQSVETPISSKFNSSYRGPNRKDRHSWHFSVGLKIRGSISSDILPLKQ